MKEETGLLMCDDGNGPDAVISLTDKTNCIKSLHFNGRTIEVRSSEKLRKLISLKTYYLKLRR